MLILLGTAVLFPVALVAFAMWECGHASVREEATVARLMRPVLGALGLWFMVLLLALEPASRSIAADLPEAEGTQGAAFAAAATLVIVVLGFRAVQARCGRGRQSSEGMPHFNGQ